MAERVLSAMSQRVLEELTTGPKAVTKGTSLARIQSVLECDEAVAEVVVAELQAAGYIRESDGGKRIPLRSTPVDPDTGRFTRAIESVAADAMKADRLLQQTVQRHASSPPAIDSSGWAATHGLRALTMLSIAWERGWYELVCSFAAPLGRLLRAAGQPESAREAVAIGIDAENRLRQVRLATLWMVKASVSSDLGLPGEAERYATIAVVRALEAADENLLASAYGCRGDIRERTGHSAAALEDFERAAAVSAGTVSPGDASGQQASSPFAQARFHAAMSRLDKVAGQLASQHDTAARTEILSILGDALSSAAHADPLWIQMARAVRALREMLPSLDAAEVVMTVARHADSTGRLALAREYYEQAIDLYRAAHHPQQAETARALLDALDVRDTGQGHAKPR